MAFRVHRKALLFSLLFPSLLFLAAVSMNFEVGGNKGWRLPSSAHDADFYNKWASKNRFQVDDILHFKYEKDSVLLVTEEEYDKCRSTRPLFFSNNGDTELKLDRPGPFYFISGIAGHCERGLKMIIKVLEPVAPPPSPAAAGNQTSSPPVASSSSAGPAMPVVFMTLLSVVGVAILA